MGRISIGGALWTVAFVAIGFGAIRSASILWVGVTFLMTLGWLCTGVLGVIHGRGQRAWWLGFAVFGWAYFLLGTVGPWTNASYSASKAIANGIVESSIGTLPTANPAYTDYLATRDRAQTIAQCLFVLLFARAGASVSCLMVDGLPRRRGPANAPPSG